MWWRQRAAGSTWLGPAAKKFIDEVVAGCEMSGNEESSGKQDTMVVRAIGIEVMHKQAYTMATLFKS